MPNSSDPNVHKRLEERLHELPVLPTVVAALMMLDRRDEQYFDSVLSLLETEPNFSTRILAAANSAAAAGRDPVMTLRAAIARIGSNGASNLVLALSVTRVFVPRDAWERSLWRHAIQVATAARELAVVARDPDVVPDEAYTCGLLHDVGRFVLFQEAPEKLRRIDEGDWEDPEGLVAMEKAVCGFSHTELGALACSHWGLPETIVQVVRDHHLPSPERPVGKIAKLTALVHAADLAMFPSAMPGTPGLESATDDELRSRVQAHMPGFVSLGLADLRALLVRVADASETTASALGVG